LALAPMNRNHDPFYRDLDLTALGFGSSTVLERKGWTMAKDLLVTLDDAPGELARVGEALGNAGINIEGLCAIGYEGRGIAHVLVEDPMGARSALEAAGIKTEGESEVTLVDVTADVDSPGVLGRKTRKVAEAGVNLKFVYMASGGRVVIGADDMTTLRSALGS
jgi:hypothetical protein